MDKKRIEQIKLEFDSVIQVTGNEQIEFWYARDLMKLFGYTRWKNFEKAIGRAVISCETAQIEVLDHFREVTKLITAGKGAKRSVNDYMLTRYACYLIAMNGVTAVNKKENIMQVLNLKPAGYILKPVEKERILQTLKDVIGE